ncbi:MAG TPA: hypothetical protein ENJ99_00445 [Rhizobiales bacterium]|nr:hypothetical protein [Hyphomicrobiales bacterium]
MAAVARKLGSSRYMSTAPKGGTSHSRFLQGLSRFVSDAGYASKITYWGRWQMPSKYGRINITAPDIYAIQDSFSSGSAVFLSIGFYKQGSRVNEWQRIGGHFVTVVGYGVDENGNVDRDMVILHDPDDGRTGKVQKRFLRLEEMRNGTFIDRRGNEADASGHMKVTGGMRLKEGYMAVVDAVVALDL